jgi:Na+/alanine symporter
MAIIYIIIVLVICDHYDPTPGVIALVLKVLLTWKLVWSCFGLAVQWGVKF